MAKIVMHSRDLPEHTGPVPPGLKPPVYKLPYYDTGDPDEVDTFLATLREINGLDPSPTDPSR